MESIAQVFGQIFATSVLEGQSANFEQLQSVIESIRRDDADESARRGRPPFLGFLIVHAPNGVVGSANASVVDASYREDLKRFDEWRATAAELREEAARQPDPAKAAELRRRAIRILVDREAQQDQLLAKMAESPSMPGVLVYDAKIYDCRPEACDSLADVEKYAVADVLVGINYRPFVEQQRASRTLLLEVALLALFFGGAGAWWVAGRVTRPVRKLVDAMGDIERGAFGRRVETGRRDELGQLASTFNVMATGLEERERLRAERTELKREVARGESRNVELARSKDELARKAARIEKVLNALASQAVARRFVAGDREPEFAGEDIEATILFADIRGFTSMCERLETAEIFETLNDYFGRMRSIIDRYDGTILKFMGDALMVSWNVPDEQDFHALRAVYTGIDMQREIRALNKTRELAKREPLQVGIGINTGRLMVGKVGSEERFDFTVIGDAVNTAQRIESITPAQHLQISASCYEQVKEYVEVVQREPVVLKGKEKPVSIYAVLHRGRKVETFRKKDEMDLPSRKPS